MKKAARIERVSTLSTKDKEKFTPVRSQEETVLVMKSTKDLGIPLKGGARKTGVEGLPVVGRTKRAGAQEMQCPLQRDGESKKIEERDHSEKGRSRISETETFA